MMWMLFSIRLETASRTAYLLGQVRWTSGEAGATVVAINAWPSDSHPGVFFYNAFIATYNDPELFRLVIQEAGCDDDDDGINDDSTTGEEKGKEEQGDEDGWSGAGGAPPHFVDASPSPGFAAGTSRAGAAEQQQYYSRIHGEEEEVPPPPHLDHAAATTNPWVELMASLEEKRGGPISNVDTAEMRARGDTRAALQEALRVWQAENVSARRPREQEQGGRCSPSSSDLPRDLGDGEGSE